MIATCGERQVICKHFTEFKVGTLLQVESFNEKNVYLRVDGGLVCLANVDPSMGNYFIDDSFNANGSFERCYEYAGCLTLQN